MKVDYILKKSNRRSISIKISDEGKVLIKAPNQITIDKVEEFLYEKRDWILKQINREEIQNSKALEMGSLSEDDVKKIKKEARKLIPERVHYYSQLMGVTYNRISIRLQKSRWGSCTADGNLNFNCLLVLMPQEILDSVVVHELCHRNHMNHSKAFYAEVLKYFPDYKRCDKWLKENGKIYFKRIENFTESM